MANRSPIFILFRDEFVGFAKSKVMLVLWLLMPAISIAGYLLLPASLKAGSLGGADLTATMFMSGFMSTIAGSIAAVMVAVDIVTERNRKVYELFVIRPISRDAIIWSKFLAVTACVTLACVIAIMFGVVLDAIRGDVPTGSMLSDLARSLSTLLGVLVLSAADGVFIGILSRGSVVVAVIVILQVGQAVVYLPLLPGFFGYLPDLFWVAILLSFVLAFVLVYAAAVMFRRTEF